MTDLSRKPGAGSYVFLFGLALFFGAFLFYPIAYVFTKSAYTDRGFSLGFFRVILFDAHLRGAILRSLALGVVTTATVSAVAIPLALISTRYRFPGKSLMGALVLVPMIMPPFVGAIGMRQLFARFGSINLLLMKLNVISGPIDWLHGRDFWGIVVLETLHLYPIMYLNVAAALSSIDPALEESGMSLGANAWGLFRRITFPLMLPGYFAGAIIVFIWAFTDLGTPLVFDYRNLVAVQIFDKVSDIGEDPTGYALVVTVILLTGACFLAARYLFGRRRYELLTRASTARQEKKTGVLGTGAIYIIVGAVTCLALLPHASVVLTSVRDKWFMSILPESYTLRYYEAVLTHPLTLPSIKKSMFYSSSSALVDLGLGIGIAYILTRKRVPGASVIDAMAMLPLALPGIVLAFGFAAGYSGTFLNPRNNPVALLIIAYAVRRLPYMVRAAYAGFQQSSISLEEAASTLGASPAVTLRRITIPLTMANLVAGTILAFSFAMLEVSDSLILAFKEQFYPITKAIYTLLGRISDGLYVASALGIWGMALLVLSLLAAASFLGRRMGDIFRL